MLKIHNDLNLLRPGNTKKESIFLLKYFVISPNLNTQTSSLSLSLFFFFFKEKFLVYIILAM